MAGIASVYPRGVALKNDTASEIVAFAARVDLGWCEAVKIKYP